MYSTSSLQGVWHHIHSCLHQKWQCKVQFDQYVTTNIGVLFPYMASLCNAVATGCNQSFYKSQRGGNLQLQSSCDQLRSSPVASPSEKLQLDFKTLPTTEFTHNHCPHSVTNVSPFYLMYGYEPRPLPSIISETLIPVAEDRIRELSEARKEAVAAHDLACKEMKDWNSSKFTPLREIKCG